jgi:hypothetical protein
MAEMGLGYGSEYQLLRYLGHHRNELNNNIRENTRLKGELFWLDYPKDGYRLSFDGEYKGLDFLKTELTHSRFKELQSKWNEYWSSNGNLPNWDGIILHKNGNNEEWIIVEAKAHLKELQSITKSDSNKNIQNAFAMTQKRFDICNNNWFGRYYQLANRLAFVNFLLDSKINASLLYIYFLNGYEKPQLKDREKVTIKNKSVGKIEEWEKVIKEEYVELDINSNAEQYISKIFIDCK